MIKFATMMAAVLTVMMTTSVVNVQAEAEWISIPGVHPRPVVELSSSAASSSSSWSSSSSFSEGPSLSSQDRTQLLEQAKHRQWLWQSSPFAQKAWFTAPVDHNNPTGETFQCKYFIDSSFYNASAPKLFFEMGGEGPLHGLGMGWMYQLAKEHGALMVAIEHRFYGDSWPGGFPKSYQDEYLKYLTVEQALADVAMLIDHLDSNSTYKGVKAKTFTYGGSYSGALSAWFRTQYPSYTRGSLSSSGVVNAVADFPEFDQQIAVAIGEKCGQVLHNTMVAFDNAWKTEEGAKRAKALFGIESDIKSSDFFYMVADGAAMADQYGSKDELCDAIVTEDATATDQDAQKLMETLATFILKFWGPNFGLNCFYDTECLINGPAERWVGGTPKSWRYQKCTQLAYLQSAPLSGLIMRSVNLTIDVLKQQCTEIFATIPNTGPINSKFGGAEPKGTNIFFSDFSDDPWQRASVNRTVSSSLPYRLVTYDGAGHCTDLRGPRSNDPAQLTAERAAFEAFLKQWMA